MTTPSTTTYSRGDIVLVAFQFTDRPVFKNRPAVVISSDAYHAGRREVIIVAVTSRIRKPLLVGDHQIARWRDGGLAKPSVVTAIVRTVKAGTITRRLGGLASGDMRAIDAQLTPVLGFLTCN